jgi:hypothetical protein
MALTFDAHSDGKVIVPDQPRELPTDVRLRVTVEPICEPEPRATAQTMADLFKGHIGRIAGQSTETLSEHTGDRFTDDLEQKRREGRL